MAVTIDIPGVGTVEARGAASEATLKELLKAMKASSGGPNAGGGGNKKEEPSPDKGGAFSNTLGKLGKAMGYQIGLMGKVAVGAVSVAKGFTNVGVASTQLISDLSDVGDSLTGAARTLNNIPVVGGMLSTVLGAVAGAVEKSTKSYQSAAASGASFGGSINTFAKSASEAGMTMEQFGSLIQKNGAGMLGLGSTTEEGAKRFSQVSKALRATGSDLYALGFSTQDINQGLANYTALLRQQGLQGKMSNAELTSGAKKYLKEMDALAKITGEERSAKEAQAKKLAADAQFQASMAGLNKDVRDSFRDTVLGLPEPLQNFTKDMLANGTATTEENQKLLAMMPQSAAMLTRMQQKMQRGEAVTMEERNALNNMMKQEGGRNLKNIKQAGAASAELAGTVQGLAATQEINTDGVIKANAAQSEAAKATDKQNQAAEEAKQKLAAFSNSFTMALANSGLLNVLLKAFEGLATVVQTFVVPVFNVFAKVLNTATTMFSSIFGGDQMKDGFGKVMETAKTLLESVGGFFEQILTSIDWKGMMDNVMSIGTTIMETVGSLITSLTPVFTQIFDIGQQLFNKLTPIFTDVGQILSSVVASLAPVLGPVLSALGTVLGGLIDMIGGAVKIVKGILTGDWSTVWDGLKGVFGGFVDSIKGIWDWMKSIVSGGLKFIKSLFSGKSTEEKQAEQAKEEQAKTEAKKAEAIKSGNKEEVARLERIEKQKADYKKAKEKEQAAEKKKADDAKKSAEAATKKDEVTKTYNDSLALLGQEAAQQKSGLIPKPTEKEKEAAQKKAGPPTTEKERAEAAIKTVKNSNVASGDVAKAADGLKTAAAAPKDKPATSSQAESGKKALETDAEKQKAAEAKLKAEADAKAEEERKKKETGQPGKEKAPVQESAETLLASLNTKMDQLIKINKATQDVNERQLTVQSSLSGDVFASA